MYSLERNTEVYSLLASQERKGNSRSAINTTQINIFKHWYFSFIENERLWLK